jgi:hypothetical protein
MTSEVSSFGMEKISMAHKNWFRLREVMHYLQSTDNLSKVLLWRPNISLEEARIPLVQQFNASDDKSWKLFVHESSVGVDVWGVKISFSWGKQSCHIGWFDEKNSMNGLEYDLIRDEIVCGKWKDNELKCCSYREYIWFVSDSSGDKVMDTRHFQSDETD